MRKRTVTLRYSPWRAGGACHRLVRDRGQREEEPQHGTDDRVSRGAPGGPVSSGATGSFEATIDDAARTIDYELEYSGLEGDVMQAHIHFGNAASTAASRSGSAAPPQSGPGRHSDVPALESGTVEFTLGASHVVGPAGQGIAAGEFDEFVAAIRAGRTTRTSTRPSGRAARSAARSTTTTSATTR